MPLHHRSCAWALAALAASGCSSGQAGAGGSAGELPSPAPAFPAECVIETGPGGMTPVSVAALDGDDSSLVLRQRLVPPVILDCAGTPHPGAARTWSADGSGRFWTLLLARTAPGAGAAVSAWRDPPAGETLRLAGALALVPLDQHRLTVEFDRHYDGVPPVLADPALSLPLDSSGPALSFAPVSSSDPRDALDAGAGLLRTSDPEVLAYARADSELAVAALPWSRTYVLLAPAADTLGLPADSPGFRTALARDAVAAEARAAEPPFWWETLPAAGCRERKVAAPAREADAIAFDREDPVAAALAARLVALSREPGLSARGLAGETLDSVLRSGLARGIVRALPRRALVPCRDARWPENVVVRPLVDTRASAVVRRGIVPLAVEWDGTIRPVASP